MKFNLNDPIKVKLTSRGLMLHKEKHDRDMGNMSQLIPWAAPEIDENGYSTFQAWQFIRIFGQHFIMGCVAPCEMDILIG